MGLFDNLSKRFFGISDYAPKKKGIRLFLDVFFRKFFQLIKANLFYFIISLPVYAFFLLFLAPRFTDLFSDIKLMENNHELKIAMDIVFAGLIYNFIGSGPMSAAYAYITRSYTRCEPVWIANEGLKRARENFIHSVIMLIIDILIILIITTALDFYGAKQGFVPMFLYNFILVLFGIYMMAHNFIYQIMVTYKCNLFTNVLYSFVFTFKNLHISIAVYFVTGLICYLIFSSFGFFSLVIYATFGMSFVKFPLEFYATCIIEKNIEQISNEEND